MMNVKKSEKIRVLLADDHLVVRMGIASILSFEDDLEVVGETDNGLDAARLAEELHPDIVLMDLKMPKMDGVEATAMIRKTSPATKVLILTTYGTSDDIARAMEAGSAGAIVKSSSREEIIAAIHGVLENRRTLSGEIEHTLANRIPTPEMSPRQIEILSLISKGFSNKEIAGILNVSLETVKDHIKKILGKVGASSRTEAASIAIGLKIIGG